MTISARAGRANVFCASSLALTVAAFGGACSSSNSATPTLGQGGGGGTIAGAGQSAAGTAGSGGSGARAGAGNAGSSDGGSTSAGSSSADADNAGSAGADDGPTGPVMLTGDPTAPAMSAVVNKTPTPTDVADIVDGLLLTKLDVWLTPNATVGQVNAGLAAIGGGIGYMRAGSNAITVSFPRVADETALEAKRQALASAPGVLLVSLADVADPASLPPPPADTPANIDYLFENKFPAAWNVATLATRGCETRKVPLWITDFFTATPVDNFEREVPGFTITPTKPTDVAHGYRVTAIAAAQYDSNPTTGANPFIRCLDLRGVRIDGFSPLERNGVIAKALSGTKGIVNGSFGHPIPGCKGGECAPANFQNKAQLFDSWVLKVADWRRETLQFDDAVLFVAAGGNTRVQEAGVRYQVFRDARIAGEMAMASSNAVFGSPRLSIFQDTAYFQPDAAYPTFPSLATPSNVAQALLTSVNLILAPSVLAANNVVIVGSTNRYSEESSYSNANADVHAVGEDIPVVDGNNGSGTSYSAPLVAGLASYLWLLSDDLRLLPARITRRAIIDNTAPTVDNPAVHKIDAFASALSLDKSDSPPTPASAPVRLALLDVNDDGVFNEVDVTQLWQAYGQTPIPQLTWGRMDLNGDGVVGGTGKSRFDLDRNGSTQFGAAVYSTVLQRYADQVMTYDEQQLGDRQILCYYAYSLLYTGNTDARDDLIGAGCGFPNKPTNGGGTGGNGGMGGAGSGGNTGGSCQSEGSFFCTSTSCCPGSVCVYINAVPYPQCYKQTPPG